MGFISIAERLKLLATLSRNKAYTNIHRFLELHENILCAYEHFFTAHPTAIADWMSHQSVIPLEEKALNMKEPIIRLLDERSFKLDALLSIQDKILKCLTTDPLLRAKYENYHTYVANNSVDLMQLITAVMQGHETVIQSYAAQFELDPSHFLFILSSVLQPFIEALANALSARFYEKWWQNICPVCGRIPAMARIRKRRRYLMCTFCGAEYLSDHFLCVHCRNRDPYTLQYLQLTEKPALRVDYCLKCNGYIKVINEDKIKEIIPRFLEDILTLDLDLYAQHAGLTREP